MKPAELKKTVKEASVQSQILEYLTYQKSVAKYWRVNTGATRFAHTSKDGSTKRYFVKFGVSGMPPGIGGFMRDGRALFIGVKRPVGGKISNDQQEFIEDAKKAGCVAFFATSVEDVYVNLKKEGY